MQGGGEDPEREMSAPRVEAKLLRAIRPRMRGPQPTARRWCRISRQRQAPRQVASGRGGAEHRSERTRTCASEARRRQRSRRAASGLSTPGGSGGVSARRRRGPGASALQGARARTAADNAAMAPHQPPA